MRKYDSYKDSVIEWLGKIPAQWEVKRLKDLGGLQNGISNGKDYFGFGFPFLSYGNVYNNTIRISEISTLANSTLADQKAYSVLEGDVFFTRTSETIDEIGIASTCLATIPKATFSGFTIRLRPKRRIILKEFSKYFFKAHINRQFLSKEISLVTRASLSQNLLNNMPVLLPTKNEQSAIAQYLDTKTQAIDKKVNLLEKKIGYYKELRKSIINETVTKGLDKNIKMKDSVIDWIGQIPEHWEVKRAKDLFFEFPKSKITANEGESKGIYKFFTSSNEQTKWLDYFTMENEAILFSTGGCAGVNYCDKEYSYSTDCWAIYGNKKVFLKYFAYYFEKILNEIQQKGFKGSSLEHLQKNFITASEIILPPKQEQTEIAIYLDHKTQTIDKIVDNIKNQVATFKELRKTLINDVVTGKIKVVE